jgi:hypothetical protein
MRSAHIIFRLGEIGLLIKCHRRHYPAVAFAKGGDSEEHLGGVYDTASAFIIHWRRNYGNIKCHRLLVILFTTKLSRNTRGDIIALPFFWLQMAHDSKKYEPYTKAIKVQTHFTYHPKTLMSLI